MKLRTKFAVSVVAITAVSIFSSEYTSPADGRNSGAPAGYTGSPGDGRTCSRGCHGASATTVAGLITSNVPADGYTPGTTYTITGTIGKVGRNKYGFSMSPQDASGNILGTLINKGSDTQINGAGFPSNSGYVTHTSSGMTGTNDSHTWSVDWTAPAAGTGDVTFYGIFMIATGANGDNNDNSSDELQQSTLLLNEKVACNEPTITSTTADTVCDSGSLTLSAAASAGTIDWYAASTGGTSLYTGSTYTTPSLSTTTSYYVDATNSGCTTSTRTEVVATVFVTPTIAGTTPGSRCDSGTVVLGATASSGTVYWYADAVGGSPLGSGTSFTTPGIASSTDYYAEAVNGNCVSASRTAVTATVNPPATISSVVPDTICGSGTAVLNATSTDTVKWYANAIGGSVLATGSTYTTTTISATTTFYVDATSPTCTSASRTAITAVVTDLPTITATTPGAACDSGAVVLGAAASSGTISWYAEAVGGSSIATGTSYTTPLIYTSTTYYVDAADGTCTSTSRTAITATVNTSPTATVTGDTTICSGASSILNVQLTGTSPWSFEYGSSAGSNAVSGVTSATYTTSVSAGTYTVSALSDGNGCAGTVSGSAAIIESAPIMASTSTITCDGTNSSYTVAFDISGGNSAAYSVTGAGTLSGTSFISDPVTSGTTYNYTVNDDRGCSPITVSGTKNCSCAASAEISGGGTICSGNSATISIALAGSAPWSFIYSIDGVKQPEVTNQTTSPYTFTTTTAGTYTLDSVADSNCEGSTGGSATVSQALPTATLSGGGSICNDGSTTNLDFSFTGTGPWSFTYTDGTITSATLTSSLSTKSVAVSSAGTYSIASFSDANCTGTGSGTTTVIVNELPTVSVSVSPSATVCPGTLVSMTASGASSYVWSNASTQTTLQVSPTTTTTYTVTGTDGNSCSNSITQTITVSSLPTVTATASPSETICVGSSVTLTGSGASTYTWSDGVNDGQSFVPTTNATYTVTGTDAQGCSSSTTIAVILSPCSNPSVTISSSVDSICVGDLVSFTATPVDGGLKPTYQWVVNGVYVGNNSDTYNSYNMRDGDQVYVKMVSNASGVSSDTVNSNTITITVIPTPTAPTISRPDPGNQLLSSEPSGNFWYFNGLVFVPNETNQTLQLNRYSQTGEYSVTVTKDGCTSSPSSPYSFINTGINEAENSITFAVYPNPTSGIFTVDFEVNKPEMYTVEIENFIGEMVYKEKLDGFTGNYLKQVNLSMYGAGVYEILVYSSETFVVKKIIVY